ncbi:MAG TPA: S8 family serine peptidase [Candidatus Binatia bacterium]|nr:S8 family serine peptidase [Candidatus Binatia bacterium]
MGKQRRGAVGAGGRPGFVALLAVALLLSLLPGPAAASEPDVGASTEGEPQAGAEVDAGASPAPSTEGADPTDRYIVILRDRDLAGDPDRAIRRVAERAGVRAERTFDRAVRGFAAKLDPATRKRLAADPAVAAVVPDERIEISGFVPTGVRRVKAPASSVADIDATDDARVDADIAIVDTGIDPSHPDLNVVGGYNCSTSDPTAWYDEHGHGTHVAGTAAAIDRPSGLTGVAPGARLWAVRILGPDGSGLLSWYLCGLDWIAAQRDPSDPSRPLFEAVNMSVAKWGRDDGNCGFTNGDLLHQAICRLVAAGITVVAAAANDASSAAARVPAAYDEVITVSALADTDGVPGGRGGSLCWSWGGYDVDDTFADFSNYGADVDLIAPGKCIWSSLPGGRRGYMSGTSMAAPHVTGAVALYKASRPEATPAEVREALRYLGSFDWATSTDPDGVPDPLLDVSRIGPLGTFSLRPDVASEEAPLTLTEAGGTIEIPITIARSATFFEPVTLEVAALPSGFSASLSPSRAFGFEAVRATLRLGVPKDTPTGRYEIRIRGSYHSLVRETTVVVDIAPPGLSRSAGPDRYATAAAISAATFGPGVPVAYVATGLNFPDALAAAAAAGFRGGPVLLVTRDAIPAPTATELGRLRPERIVVVGSTGVVGNGVAAALAEYLAAP